MSLSSRTLAMFLLLTVCIASLPKTTHCFDFREWLERRRNKATPKDCAFTHWGPWKGCTQIDSGKVQRKRTRLMSQPKNNGKACPSTPILAQWEDCSDIQFMADKFISAIHSAGPAPTKGPAPARRPLGDRSHTSFVRFNITHLRDSQSTCREFKDAHGKTRMAGGQCGANSRLRRSAPFTEQRLKRGAPTIRNWDIVFLLDESGSIGKNRFEDTVVYLAVAITKSFCGTRMVKSSLTRIGVASFDSGNHERFTLNNVNMNNAAGLINAIAQLKYETYPGVNKGTCLESALRYCKDHMFHPYRGARIDSQTEQMIILITDGCANCNTGDLASAASYLYNADISLFTIFIGDNPRCVGIIENLENSNERCWSIVSPPTWADAKFLGDIYSQYGCDDFADLDHESCY